MSTHPATRPRRATQATTGSDPTPKDEGSITLFVVIIAMALFVVIGLVVDGAGKTRALQHADHAAQEAARAAGQQLLVPQLVTGGAPVPDTARAARAARAYLRAADVTGTVTVTGATVTVRTNAHYDPIFVSIIGVGRMTVTGSAQARPQRSAQETP
ncbi:MAG: hypothetical protein QOD63_1087 [Actinomycetota bacterium]|nr:hypothetical protein [Actinomycetota bacterium]